MWWSLFIPDGGPSMWRPAEPDATSSGPAVDGSVTMRGRRCCTPCASWGHGAIGHGPFRVRRLVGVSHDQRLRRTAELMIGVAVGIAVAELLIWVLSPGTRDLTKVAIM